MKTTKILITLTPTQKEKAQKMSKKHFGRVNLSGFLATLIEKEWAKKQN